MRRFGGTLEKEDELRVAVNTPSWAGAAAHVLVRLGDKDISDRVEEAKWGSGEGNATALTFEGKVSGYVDLDYENAPLEVRVLFAGFEILEFRGVGSILEYENDHSTSIRSFSAGTYLDKVPLKQFVEYYNTLPEYVIRDAVYRVRSYNRSDVVITPFGRPLINYNANAAAQQGFEEEDNPASILSRVFETVGAVAVDTPNLGLRCFANPYLGVGIPLSWTYSAEDILDWKIPTLATPDEQYTSVIVAHADEGQSSATRIKRVQEVNWAGFRYPPTEDIPLYVSFTDVGPNADARAADLAMRNARAAGWGRHKTSFTVSYNPFLEKYDTALFKERFRDDKGPWEREWLAVLDGGVGSHFSSTVALETIGACTLTVQKKERVRDVLGAITGAASRRRRTPGVIGRFMGIDALGLWFNPIEAGDWAGFDTGGLWVETEGAPEYVGSSVAGLWFDPEGEGRIHDVGIDEVDGLWIDTGRANDWTGQDAGGFWIETSGSFAWTGQDEFGIWLDPEGAAGL